MIVTAITNRGMRLDDLKLYTIGGIIDYIVTWNNIMLGDRKTADKDEVREATTEDIARFKSL